MSNHYDAAIIGSGQAANPLATALAEAGRRVALIERAHLGGTCVNEGCTPTKTMVASARVAHLARRAADYGVGTGPISIDMARVRERKRAIVDSFRGGSERRIAAAAGVDLLMGSGRFVGERSIEVALNEGGTRQISAAQVFINTGTSPAAPGIPGLATVPTLTSTSIMELATVPEHLIVLGGGYIGLEFGQMFRRFGSRVTIVQRGDQLLGREDRDVAEAVAAILREDGVELLLNAEARGAAPDGGGVSLTIASPEGERQISGSHLLVAAGRAPNTADLNLEAAGVKTDRHGFITVNERLETSAPGVYALGDVKGGPAFTHISYDDFRILRANLLEGGAQSTAGRLVPYTVFIDPQLGRVGLSEQEAREQGYRIKVARMPASSIARALETDETRGLWKAVVDAETDQILGCATLSVDGGEVMAVIQMAMLGKLPYTVLRDRPFAHPTTAESLNNLFSAFDTSSG